MSEELQPPTEKEIGRRRKAHAVALQALAAFNRYQTGLDPALSPEERKDKIQQFFSGAGSTYIEELEAIGAYGSIREEYNDEGGQFLPTMACMLLAELTYILPRDMIALMMYDVFGDDMLKRHVLVGIEKKSNVIMLGRFPTEDD